MSLKSVPNTLSLVVEAHRVSRTYSIGSHCHQALNQVSLEIRKGDFCDIAGPSGSGKTTLLNILGCLDRPTEGDVLIEGVSTKKFSVNELAKFRSENLGFIFQTFNLIPTLSALENVEYPLLLLSRTYRSRRELAEEALKIVGLENFKRNRPGQLSGGQRQRVAIARALVKKPLLILADEPTANLDRKNSIEILDLMSRLHEENGVTFLFSSHDPLVLKRATKISYLSDGRQEPIPSEERMKDVA
ncbi:MAG: ABC transporter ATP-binding protein [Deltaproteobacteria bacterium]|nr:ABC transporter ATP-binding protein [Deltaproteobacteria bacterium]